MLNKKAFEKQFISELLIGYRNKHDLQQIHLASLLGVTQTSVSNYEGMINFPNKAIVAKIATLFNLSITKLFETPIANLIAFKPPLFKVIHLEKASLQQIFDELKKRGIVTTLTLLDK